MTSASTPAPRPIVVEQSGPVTTIRLNRPHALNAMTVELLTDLVAALRAAGTSRAVVLHGAGRAFCAGEDLKETLAPRTGQADELRRSFDLLQETTRLITALGAPVIAAVHGYAVGGGIELALAADLVVVQDDARIRFPEVPIGHAHTGAITARLPQLVGLMRAKELLLTGRWVSAAEAVALGLAVQAVPDALARATEMAEDLAALPARSLAAAKRSLELATVPAQEQIMRLEVEAATHCFASAEAGETFESFRATKNVPGAR